MGDNLSNVFPPCLEKKNIKPLVLGDICRSLTVVTVSKKPESLKAFSPRGHFYSFTGLWWTDRQLFHVMCDPFSFAELFLSANLSQR